MNCLADFLIATALFTVSAVAFVVGNSAAENDDRGSPVASVAVAAPDDGFGDERAVANWPQGPASARFHSLTISQKSTSEWTSLMVPDSLQRRSGLKASGSTNLNFGRARIALLPVADAEDGYQLMAATYHFVYDYDADANALDRSGAARHRYSF